MRRLNLGCGDQIAEGWVNVDRVDRGQAYVLDFRDPLPFDEDEFDLIVAHHSLPTLDDSELRRCLGDLLRIAKPGGVLRISVPSIAKAIDAWQRGNWAWFPNSTGVGSITDVTFCEYVTWYGHHKSVFTYLSLAARLLSAGWQDPRALECGRAWHNEALCSTSLDSRADESLFVEAIK